MHRFLFLAALLCAVAAGCQCGDPLHGAAYGTLWISSGSSGRLMVLDAADGGWIGQVDLPGDGGRGAAVAARPDGEQVFVANEGAGSVSIINARDLSVWATTTDLLRPRDVQPSPNGQLLFVAQAGSDEMALIQLSTLAVSRVPASGGVAAARGESVWVTPAGNVYMVSQSASTVAWLRLPDGPAAWSLPVTLNPTRMVATRNGEVGYVAGALDGVVQQITLSGNGSPDAGALAPVGDEPSWLSLSQDDRWLIVSNGVVDNTVSILDLSQGFTELGKVVVGGGLVGHNVLSPAGTTAYVAVGLPPQIAVVDLVRQAVVATYALPEPPRGLAYVPRLSR